MDKKIPVIAIDGTAASGKGTMAKRLAAYLDYAYLDTGLLYRRVALTLLAQNIPADNIEAAVHAARTLDASKLDDPALRGAAAGRDASVVAAIPEVRMALHDFQREFPAQSGKVGAILDGRDIGTVIFPDALIKFYIDADIEIRAERRYKELTSHGLEITYEKVLEDMKIRDARDGNRDFRPMVAAEDAILIDTSEMNADESFSQILYCLELNGFFLADQWLHYFSPESLALFSVKQLAEIFVSDIVEIRPDQVWPLLAQFNYLRDDSSLMEKLQFPDDPAGIKLTIALGTLKTNLTEAAKSLAPATIVHDSDRLASHPADPENPTNGGVMDEEIDVEAALLPCQQAALLYPSLPRLSFQYARVLMAAGCEELALVHFLNAAEQGHGGACGYLGDICLYGLCGMEIDPPMAKEYYARAAESGFWMAQDMGDQIEKLSPDEMTYKWDLERHEGAEYYYLSNLIQLSNGMMPTDSGLPPENIICYVVASLAGISTQFIWMIDPEVLPEKQLISGKIKFSMNMAAPIQRAAVRIKDEDLRETFMQSFYDGAFDTYLNMGFEDGKTFAAREGAESGALELYIQTAMALYFDEKMITN